MRAASREIHSFMVSRRVPSEPSLGRSGKEQGLIPISHCRQAHSAQAHTEL